MACECLNIVWTGDVSGSGDFVPAGLYNGVNYFTFQIEGTDYYIYWSGTQWEFSDTLGGPPLLINKEESSENCPTGTWQTPPETPIFSYSIVTAICGVCEKLQQRDFKKYSSIKLPVVFEEEDRGFFRCCEPELVLASNTADTWKNDKTAAWIKLSNAIDTVTFGLTKDGQPASYVPTVNTMPAEQFGFFTVIDWKTVLSTDGPGCYELTVDYNISGILSSFTWGIYKLLPYTIENALKTARVRTIFNSFYEPEGINFTGALVENTFRFYGLIGLRQPNTEIDNIIYQDRTMKKVIRENLNTYEINTDPLKEEFITKLTDVLLLAENQLFISDYNAHNHSYKINDLPVILQESPEIEYFDYARDAQLTAVVSDKVKNKRSYYK